MRHEISIDLDGDEPIDSGQQGAREGAPTRTDLNDSVLFNILRGKHGDRFEGLIVNEEMLSEALARSRQRVSPSRGRHGLSLQAARARCS